MRFFVFVVLLAGCADDGAPECRAVAATCAAPSGEAAVVLHCAEGPTRTIACADLCADADEVECIEGSCVCRWRDEP